MGTTTSRTSHTRAIEHHANGMIRRFCGTLPLALGWGTTVVLTVEPPLPTEQVHWLHERIRNSGGLRQVVHLVLELEARYQVGISVEFVFRAAIQRVYDAEYSRAKAKRIREKSGGKTTGKTGGENGSSGVREAAA